MRKCCIEGCDTEYRGNARYCSNCNQRLRVARNAEAKRMCVGCNQKSQHTKQRCQGCYRKWREQQNPSLVQVRNDVAKRRYHRTVAKPGGAEKAMFWAARDRAKRAGIEFTIKLSDLRIPARCPVLGMPLVRRGGKAQPDSPSLDRIDSSKGYTPANTMIISHRANCLKNNGTLEEFEKIVRYLKESKQVKLRLAV